MRDDLLELARRQQGLLTRAQLGPTDPDWREVQPSVFAPSAIELDREQELEAIRLHLDARAERTGSRWAFAGPTAADLLGLKVPEHRPTVVVEGSSRFRLDRATVLTARRLPPITSRRQRPMADVCPAIVQSAAVLDRDALISLVEHAVRTRRCTLEQLRATCRRGVSGSRALRSVVDELSREGRDRWVRVLVRLLLAAGLPQPETERPVPLDAPTIYLDLCWWGSLLAVEVDDWETHGPREASERDRQRDRWVWRHYGITVLRVTPREIRRHPERVVRDIVAAYRRAEARARTATASAS